MGRRLTKASSLESGINTPPQGAGCLGIDVNKLDEALISILYEIERDRRKDLSSHEATSYFLGAAFSNISLDCYLLPAATPTDMADRAMIIMEGWVHSGKMRRQWADSIQKSLRSQLYKDEDYEWKNQELGIYFKAQPNDPVWKVVTPQIADLIQQGFLEIWQRTNLEKYTDTNSLPPEIIDLIGEVANKVGEPNNLNPAISILVTHQYVDTDQLMRQMYRTRWVAFMVSRNSCAPSPESYHKYIMSRYFIRQRIDNL